MCVVQAFHDKAGTTMPQEVTVLPTEGRICNTTRPEAPCRIPAD